MGGTHVRNITEAKSTQFVSSRQVVRRVRWGIRSKYNTEAWFSGIMVKLPKKFKGVGVGKIGAFGHVGSAVLMGCQADVQQAHGIRENGLGGKPHRD